MLPVSIPPEGPVARLASRPFPSLLLRPRRERTSKNVVERGRTSSDSDEVGAAGVAGGKRGQSTVRWDAKADVQLGRGREAHRDEFGRCGRGERGGGVSFPAFAGGLPGCWDVP